MPMSLVLKVIQPSTESANVHVEEFNSKGIRVAKGLFVTCAHSVSEQVTESSDPIWKHFRRVKISVEGKTANLLLIGETTPSNLDIALLQAQDDWAGMDLGSMASVKRTELDTYRVASLSLSLILECLFRGNIWVGFYLVAPQAPGLYSAWTGRR